MILKCGACIKEVDTQLYVVMRVISGTVKSTPLQWIPVLTNIEPPNLRRKEKLIKMIEKTENKRVHN